MIKLIISMVFLAVISGCTVIPKTIDLSESEFKPIPSETSRSKKISSLIIHNKAENFIQVNKFLDDSLLPFNYSKSTKDLVELDLKDFFEKNLIIDGSEGERLVVTINRADGYSVFGGVNKVPFLGILTTAAGNEVKYVMIVRALFEVEKNGKVISSYIYDEKITTLGSGASIKDEEDSYKKLIANYRLKIFTNLKNNFIDRYL